MDDYCTRPSWVDAEAAYKQLLKGRVVGNKLALYTRSRMQRSLFRFGCFIQNHRIKTLIVGLVLLSLCSVGLKTSHVETRVEKLWVENGGRLSRELSYIRSQLGEDSDTVNELVLVQTAPEGETVTNVQSLQLHQRAMTAATQISIRMFGTSWKLKDICYKTSFPLYTEQNHIIDDTLESLVPCMIITPLDCFWEGSTILGPERQKYVPNYGAVKWTTMNPREMVLALRRLASDQSLIDEILRVIDRAGIGSGYQEKPCLDPHDMECPATAPNWSNKQEVNVAGELDGGCSGFAEHYMQWDEDLIVGGITRNLTDHITSAKALQSIIHLMGAHELYDFYKDHNKVTDWSREKAARVLAVWQRKFTQVITDMANSTQTQGLHPFSMTSLVDILTDFSQISMMRVALGYGLMLGYACLSLLKWRDVLRSQSGLGIAGVLLVALSVAAGLGFCSVISLPFNAASTQIVPFLALGLGVDDMFLFVRALSDISKNAKIPPKEQVGVAVKRVGVSLVVTSVCISGSFFTASIIPVPALRTFSLQCGILVLFNLITMLVIFPAVVSYDVSRREKHRIDVFCCFTGLTPEQKAKSHRAVPYSRGASPPPPYSVHHPSTHSDYQMYPMETKLASEKHNKTVTILSKDSQHYASSSSSLESVTSRRYYQHPAHTGIKLECCSFSLSSAARKVYGPQVAKKSHKIFVLVLFAVLFGAGIYGSFQVEDGLDLSEIVPSDTPEYEYLGAQSKYFGFYSMYLITEKNFEYAEQQALLHDYHAAFSKIEQIIDKNSKYWLAELRDWLSNLQEALDAGIAAGCVTSNGTCSTASSDAILAYKLILQTGDDDEPLDKTRVEAGRLVDSDGIIYAPAFYNYITAWASNDALAYAAAQGSLHPEPKEWYFDVYDHYMLKIPRSGPLTFTQFPFMLHNLQKTSQITSFIKDVRAICDHYSRRGLPNFPSGIPFTYWEQYMYLRYYLILSLAAILVGLFVLLTVVLMNPWIAAILVLVLGSLAVELFGFMGFVGLKLSAVPAVIIIASVGVSVEFTVHIALGFLTSVGDRDTRTARALQHMLPPVVHGAMSTLIGIVMLALAEFTFIFQYFFMVLAMLIALGLLNGLVLLPVLLSILGPNGEVGALDGSCSIAPPTPPVPKRKTKSSSGSARSSRHPLPRVTSLTTISEESTQYTSSQDTPAATGQQEQQPKVTVETSPAVVTTTTTNVQKPKKKHAGGERANPSSVTTVETTATFKVQVHTPLLEIPNRRESCSRASQSTKPKVCYPGAVQHQRQSRREPKALPNAGSTDDCYPAYHQLRHTAAPAADNAERVRRKRLTKRQPHRRNSPGGAPYAHQNYHQLSGSSARRKYCEAYSSDSDSDHEQKLHDHMYWESVRHPRDVVPKEQKRRANDVPQTRRHPSMSKQSSATSLPQCKRVFVQPVLQLDDVSSGLSSSDSDHSPSEHNHQQTHHHYHQTKPHHQHHRHHHHRHPHHAYQYNNDDYGDPITRYTDNTDTDRHTDRSCVDDGEDSRTDDSDTRVLEACDFSDPEASCGSIV